MRWGSPPASCRLVEDTLDHCAVPGGRGHAAAPAAQTGPAAAPPASRRGRYARLDASGWNCAGRRSARPRWPAAEPPGRVGSAGVVAGAQEAVATVSAAAGARVTGLREGLAVSSTVGNDHPPGPGGCGHAAGRATRRGVSSELRGSPSWLSETARALVERAEAAQREHQDMLAQQERLAALEIESTCARGSGRDADRAGEVRTGSQRAPGGGQGRGTCSRTGPAPAGSGGGEPSVRAGTLRGGACRSAYDRTRSPGASRHCAWRSWRGSAVPGRRRRSPRSWPGHPCPSAGPPASGKPASATSGEDVSAEVLTSSSCREGVGGGGPFTRRVAGRADAASQALHGASADLEAVVEGRRCRGRRS
ncbi:hypothetical protein QJS66_00495 [Kocuria rhizophila]|nr:hypothetical protein QJS66_00495 [Kocuria rhizophila]